MQYKYTGTKEKAKRCEGNSQQAQAAKPDNLGRGQACGQVGNCCSRLAQSWASHTETWVALATVARRSRPGRGQGQKKQTLVLPHISNKQKNMYPGGIK